MALAQAAAHLARQHFVELATVGDSGQSVDAYEPQELGVRFLQLNSSRIEFTGCSLAAPQCVP